MGRRLPLWAALAALVVAGGVLVTVLARSDIRVTGSNNEFGRAPGPRIQGGVEVCQPDESVPAGTQAIRVTAEGPPPVTLGARLRVDGRMIAGRPVTWDGATRVLDLPLGTTVARDLAGAQVCFLNGGASEIGFFGFERGPGLSAEIDGQPIAQRLRITYVRARPESYATSTGRILDRVGTARGSLLDGWAGYGAIVAGAALVGLVLVGIRRELAP